MRESDRNRHLARKHLRGALKHIALAIEQVANALEEPGVQTDRAEDLAKTAAVGLKVCGDIVILMRDEYYAVDYAKKAPEEAYRAVRAVPPTYKPAAFVAEKEPQV